MSNTKIEIGKAIGYGWGSVKKDFWYFTGIALVSTIISSLGNSNGKKSNGWSILSPFLSTWMTCGHTKIVLDYHSGNKLPIAELFTQFKYYWRVLFATLFLGVIVCLGLIFLIVPGVYFAIKYQFTIQLIIDKDLSISEALKQSAQLTNGLKMSLLGFNITLLGVVLLGAICLGVGVFVAIPVVWLAEVFIYRRLSEATTAVISSPAK
jgi:uncharacterized membrane protein